MPDLPASAPARHRSPNSLYDALAAGYDASYAVPGHRKAYDVLAWERVTAFLPAAPATVIDAGCGTGRWVEKFLDLGHRVVGIERQNDLVALPLQRLHGLHPRIIELTALTDDNRSRPDDEDRRDVGALGHEAGLPGVGEPRAHVRANESAAARAV